MAHWTWYVLGAIAAAELYRNFTSEEKQEWENKIRMHHGEVGALMAPVGLLTESPRLAATGIGLAVHDINDVNKWFTGDKQKS